jgi:hypothetical protein
LLAKPGGVRTDDVYVVAFLSRSEPDKAVFALMGESIMLEEEAVLAVLAHVAIIFLGPRFRVWVVIRGTEGSFVLFPQEHAVAIMAKPFSATHKSGYLA